MSTTDHLERFHALDPEERAKLIRAHSVHHWEAGMRAVARRMFSVPASSGAHLAEEGRIRRRGFR
jgi:hypothetical protein